MTNKLDFTACVLDIEKAARDGDQRIIKGIATMGTPDRVGDVVNPMGAEYKLPIPLLWHHNQQKPIGHVIEATKSEKGIRFVAKIVDPQEDGELKTFVDRCWQEIKEGLVAHVSIGARRIRHAWNDDRGARDIMQWEWLELSCVTIPMHQRAAIDSVKAMPLDEVERIDADLIATNGEKSVSVALPAAAGRTVKLSKGLEKMDYQSRLNLLKKTKENKQAELDTLNASVANEGRTKTQEEREEYNQLVADLKSLNLEISEVAADLEMQNQDSEQIQKSAKPLDRQPALGGNRATILHKEHIPGLDIARAAMCIVKADGSQLGALDLARQYYEEEPRVSTFLKAAVGANTTLDSPGTAAVSEAQTMVTEFIEWMWPETILGKLGQGKIPAPRKVPFNKKVSRSINAGSAGYIKQGKPIKVSRQVMDQVELKIMKLGALNIFSNDLLEFGNIDVEMIVRDNLAGVIIEEMDKLFADPSNAGAADEEPASIFNGLTPKTTQGTDAAGVSNDVAQLVTDLIDAGHKVNNIVLVMGAKLAVRIAALRSALGTKEFPTMGPNGGELDGYPAIASSSVPDNVIGAFDARNLIVARGDSMRIDLLKEASIEMNDAPIQDGNAGTGAAMVSLPQNDLIGVRAIHHSTWVLGRATGAAVITTADYNPPTT